MLQLVTIRTKTDLERYYSIAYIWSKHQYKMAIEYYKYLNINSRSTVCIINIAIIPPFLSYTYPIVAYSIVSLLPLIAIIALE